MSIIKKTVLSIMTITILTSTSAHASAINKDIVITAKTTSSVDIVNATTGKKLNPINLTFDTSMSNGTYFSIMQAKVKSFGGAEKINITLTEVPQLVSGEKKFTAMMVSLNDEAFTVNTAKKLTLKGGELPVEIKISGKAPVTALEGEAYKGVIKLALEPTI